MLRHPQRGIPMRKMFLMVVLFLFCFLTLPTDGSAIPQREAAPSPQSGKTSKDIPAERDDEQSFKLPLLIPQWLGECREIAVYRGQYDGQLCEIVKSLIEDFENHRLKQVLLKCRAALDRYPESGFVHFMLGMTYYNLGDSENSLKEIDKALRINPEVMVLKLWKALIYLGRGDRVYAETVISELLNQDPKNLDAHFIEAQLKLFDHNYEQAVIIYKRMIKSYPSQVSIYLHLSDVYAAMGRYEEALSELDMYMAKEPTSQWGLLQKITILLAMDKIDGAVMLYKKAFSDEDSSHLALFTGLGIAYAQKDYSRVTAIAQRFLNDYPELIVGYLASFYAYSAKRDFTSAADFAGKINDKFPAYKLRAKIWGDLFFQQERYADAIARYKESLEANLSEAGAYVDLGFAYAAAGQYRQALDIY